MNGRFLILPDSLAYENWWNSNVAGPVTLPIQGHSDVIVHISKAVFKHACYESTRGHDKDKFSKTRAMRMHNIVPMIKSGCQSPNYHYFCGYDGTRQTHTRLVIEDPVDFYVVVIGFRINKKKCCLTGDLITTYVADRHHLKIEQSPRWRYKKCCDEYNM